MEGLDRYKSTKFTREERVVDKALRSLFFDNLEEIGGAYEIKEFKRTVMIKRPYQCGTAVYQLTKLRMLEFYYDFLDKYFRRQDFELCYMDRSEEMKHHMKLTRKIGLQQTNVAREHPAYLSLSL